MNKLYLFGPLAALAAFGGGYWKFEQRYEARQAEIARQTQATIDEKLAKNAADQARAREEARVAHEARLREKAEADRKADEQRLARDDAERRRLLAGERARKLQAQVDRLRLEGENAKHLLATSEENRRVLQAEQQFLLQCVDEAEANRKGFFELLQKLERNDEARAREAAALVRRPAA
jgi:hypothetical protein